MRKVTLALLLVLLGSGFVYAQEKAKPAGKAKAEKAAPAAPVDDATLTANVKEKLSKTPSLKDVPISVETKDGVVKLTGTVKTGGLKGVATNVTKSVKGVQKVDNQLTVEKAAGAPKAGGKKAAEKKG